MAFFCAKTGVRIVAPGVSKAVDPENGQDEYTEPTEAEPVEATHAKASETAHPKHKRGHRAEE